MRALAFTLCVSALLSISTKVVVGAEKAPPRPAHPAEVALVQEGADWVYRHAPTRVRLYVSDNDPAGKSVCNLGCDTRWIPLTAPADAKPIGEWAAIKREDGKFQWAYKKQPVYVRVHDSPEKPLGDGADGVWRLLEP
jgi:predicted lipoprotein with Yx(FWY)xxD motif